MITFSQFITEKYNKDIVAIYPGRFQFPHKGHMQVYKDMLSRFGRVYITTSNKQEEGKSPFTFEEKKKLLVFAGIPEKAIVQTQNPNFPKEVTGHMSKKQVLVVGAGDKVQSEEERFKFTKKDGSPSYYQPFKDHKDSMETFDKHGYIYFTPTFKFKVLGETMKSASELRKMFKAADEKTQVEIIKDLYGKYNKSIHELLKKKLH